MKNWWLKKSVREELEQRSITYAEYAAERNAPARENAQAAQERREARHAEAREAAQQGRERRDAERQARPEAVSQHRPVDLWKQAQHKERFLDLRVAIGDDKVFEIMSFGAFPSLMGDLAGAYAEVTGVTQRHTLTRAATVVGAATKKTDATAIVALANGKTRQTKIDGAGMLRRAETQAARFNALANAAAVRRREPPT